MVKRRFNKRGIAPLIATVLLIAFAVALGAVVMNWGRSYVEDTAALAKKSSSGQVECSTDVALHINKVLCGGSPSNGVCDLSSDGLKITVENKKAKKIYGFTIKVMDQDGIGLTYPVGLKDPDDFKINPEHYNLSLEPFEVKKLIIPHDSFSHVDPDAGKVYEIKIIPYILPGDDEDLDIIACDDREFSVKRGDEAWPSDYELNFSG